MALQCPSCGSLDTQVGIGDRSQCINCGRMFDSNGPARAGLDQTGRDALRAAADKTHEPNVVGNFADLQRLGAMLAPEQGGIADAVDVPPGVVVQGDEVTTATNAAADAGASPPARADDGSLVESDKPGDTPTTGGTASQPALAPTVPADKAD